MSNFKWRDVGLIVSDIALLSIDLPYYIFLYIRAVFHILINLVTPKPKKSLNGEVILITGAASGIGRACAIEIATRANVTLVLWDINEAELQDTSKECEAFGAKVYSYVIDLSNRQNIVKTAAEVLRKVDGVTILFNNAGFADYASFLDADPIMEEKVIKVDLMSYFWTIREFLPYMIETGKGHLVSTCSGLSFARARFATSYVASKYGMRGFLECLKLELKNHPKRPNINFTTIYPGFVKTPIISPILWIPRYSDGNFSPMDPKYVAGKIVDGIERQTEDVMIPSSIKFFATFSGLLPRQFMNEVEKYAYGEVSITKTQNYS